MSALSRRSLVISAAALPALAVLARLLIEPLKLLLDLHSDRGCRAFRKPGLGTPGTLMPLLRPEPKFELRTRAFVSKLNYDKRAKKVTGVIYTDLKTGEEYEQPAGMVVLSSFVFGNVQLFLLAGILCRWAAADLIAFSLFYRSNHHPIRNVGA